MLAVLPFPYRDAPPTSTTVGGAGAQPTSTSGGGAGSGAVDGTEEEATDGGGGGGTTSTSGGSTSSDAASIDAAAEAAAAAPVEVEAPALVFTAGISGGVGGALRSSSGGISQPSSSAVALLGKPSATSTSTTALSVEGGLAVLSTTKNYACVAGLVSIRSCSCVFTTKYFCVCVMGLVRSSHTPTDTSMH